MHNTQAIREPRSSAQRPLVRLVGAVVLFAMLLGGSPLATAPVAQAAEIVLRVEAQCSESLVRLSDVAEIYGSSGEVVKALGAVELFPAPTAGVRKSYAAREVLDRLALSGVNMAEHRLSGASRVEVRCGNAAAIEPAVANIPKATPNGSFVEPARATLRLATHEMLRRSAGEDYPWQIEPQFDDELVRAATTRGARVSVEGGTAPWTGRQSLTAVVNVPGSQQQRFSFTADVTVPPAVVVAVQPIVRGAIIQASDVRLDYAANPLAGESAHRLEDIVGREALRTMAAGQSLQKEWVRPPLLVKRGDAVQVSARSAGLLVRTTGKAREEGAFGDVIAVQAAHSREAFFARIVGPQEVEVFARAVDARSASATAASEVR